MKRRKALFLFITLLFLFFFPYLEMLTQNDVINSSENVHVILLMDRSGSIRGKAGSENFNAKQVNQFEELLTSKAKKLCFGEGAGEIQALLKNGGYLSVLSFGLNEKDRNFKNFIEVDDNRVNTYGFTYQVVKPSKDASIFRQIWDKNSKKDVYNSYLRKSVNNYEKPGRFFRKNQSGISLAIPMAFKYLESNKIKVSKTYVIFITDGKYNGENPFQEIEELESYRINCTQARTAANNFFELYNIKQLKLPSNEFEKDIKLKLYEIYPLQRTFSISSLVNFDKAELRFKEGEILTSSIGLKKTNDSFLNSYFQIDSLAIGIYNNTQLLSKTLHTFSKLQEDTVLYFEVPMSDFEIVKNNLELKMESWVHFTDDIYGAHILTPDGDERQGAKGLTKSISINPSILIDESKRYQKRLYLILVIGVILLFIIGFALVRYFQGSDTVQV